RRNACPCVAGDGWNRNPGAAPDRGGRRIRSRRALGESEHATARRDWRTRALLRCHGRPHCNVSNQRTTIAAGYLTRTALAAHAPEAGRATGPNRAGYGHGARPRRSRDEPYDFAGL